MGDEVYLTELIPFGQGGLDLKRSLENIHPTRLSRMKNVVRDEEGSLQIRAGQTAVFTTPGAGNVHSIVRINDPRTGAWNYVVGADDKLYHGQSGALTLIDSGYGAGHDPQHFALARPPFSGDPWVYVGQRTRTRKVRIDGLDLQIGLPAPTGQIGASLQGSFTEVHEFEAPLDWVGNAGTGGAPNFPSSVDGATSGTGDALEFVTNNAGAPADGYYNFWIDQDVHVDMNQLGPGGAGGPATDASDDDYIHIWIRCSLPGKLREVKLYFILGDQTANNLVPGLSDEFNMDAYFKVFRPSDFTPIIEQTDTAVNAGQADKDAGDLGDDQNPAEDRYKKDTPDAIHFEQEQQDPKRAFVPELALGRNQWTEFGVADAVLRRGDFLRIGSKTSELTWADVSAMCVLVSVRDTTNTIKVSLDSCFIHGGFGPDTGEPGMTGYDYRSTNYDPRTGVESNPSPIMDEDDWAFPLRNRVRIDVQAASDSALRQRVYRRGGTLQEDWYFLGQNNSNGADFFDEISDANALGAGTVDLDNDQPVTSVDARTGATLKAQPVVFFGPIQGILLAIGESNRPGHLYWSKTEEPDHWPPGNNLEVCSPSEELMAGGVFGGQAYVFSRERLFACIPNLAAQGSVSVVPTGCTHGMVSYWAMTIGAGRIWFIAKDGIYFTTGGPETNITDDSIRGLFFDETRNNTSPIFFNSHKDLRLEVHGNELWFQYRDTSLVWRKFIYSIPFNYWREYVFDKVSSMVYSLRAVGELGTGGGDPRRLLMGGRLDGTGYAHEGTSDAGVTITASLRTGALNQDAGRREKVYGDLYLEMGGVAGASVSWIIYANEETELLNANSLLTTTAGRHRHVVDAFPETVNGETRSARKRDISVDLSWTSTLLKLFFGALTYIFDEALERIRWETEEGAHNLPGWQSALYAHIALRSQQPVTLTVTGYRHDGTRLIHIYTIAGTGGTKQKVYVPFQAGKAMLYRFLLTSTAPFRLYREDSVVAMQPQNSIASVVRPLFGDALTTSRAEIGAVRGVVG